MSMLEGGGFRCDAHEFRTNEIEEWNTHCYGNPEHTESGSTACTDCGIKVEFTGLPYHKIDPITGSKNISLKCEECESKTMGTVKRTVVQ